MSSSIICVDAGPVILRVLFPAHPAQQLWDTWDKERRRVVAPALLFYEVVNALYHYQRHGWLSPAAIESALRAALALPIELVEDAEMHLQAPALAERYRLPATHDAHYLALAERLAADFWTADQRLFRTLRSAGVERIWIVEGAQQ
jgi:predicted nucleic acid-binding protein